jgi:hypothetical protein
VDEKSRSGEGPEDKDASEQAHLSENHPLDSEAGCMSENRWLRVDGGPNEEGLWDDSVEKLGLEVGALS